MELAKVTSKGQITIPVDIRKRLGIREGDKVLFIEENGRIIIMNASMQALFEAQRAMTGAAAEAGISSEDDVVALVKKLRSEGDNE